jgi:hypothetical protein
MDDILQTKVKDALAATSNNKQDAQKLLITWAVRDPQLLLVMTKPYLRAIAAALIDYAMRVKDPKHKADKDGDGATRTAIDDIVASAALHVPMDKRKKSTLPPPKSTERQASAMRKLAAAFKKKKD